MMLKVFILFLSSSILCWAHDSSTIDLLSTNDDIYIAGYYGFNDQTPMPVARSDITSTLFYANENKYGVDAIYVVGGCDADQFCSVDNSTGALFCNCGHVTDLCLVYFPSSNSWEHCATLPRPRFRHSWAKAQGKLYLMGGCDINGTNINAVDEYDPILDVWSTPYNWTNPTTNGIGFGINNMVYQVGGYGGPDTNYSAVATMNSLNLDTGEWNFSLPTMAVPRGDIELAIVNGEYYVLGGWHYYNRNSTLNTCNYPLSLMESFNPTTMTWTTRTPMNLARGDVAIGVLGDKLFAIAGETYANYSVDPTW